MQFWISVLGNTAPIAAENPVRLSVQAMKMSSTPRFFSPLSTVVQYLALSFSPTHIPSTSFFSVQIDTQGDINCLFHDLSFAADVVVDGIQKGHSVDRLQGTLLPFLGNGEKLIRDPAEGGI